MTKPERLSLSKLSNKEFPFINKLSEEQEDMVEKIFKYKRVIANCIAGSGKTWTSVNAMKVLLDKGHISKIYYVVFPVQERSLGFLPGGVADKIQEYVIPFRQALVSAGVNEQMLDNDLMCDSIADFEFKVVPHTFLRGRNLEDVGIIVDEIQNSTISELKKTLTRIDDASYVAMTGHTGQIDIKEEDSGFSALIHHFKQGKLSGEFTEFEVAHLTHNFRGKFSQFCDKLGTYN